VSDQPVAAAKADDLVVALARASVERTAPEELPLFGATSEAYLADPSALDGGKQKDDVLGFGVDAAMVLVTPVALQVARAVVTMVTEKLRERAAEEGEGALDRLLDRVLGKGDEKEPAAPAPVAELTDEQLEQVRAVALEKARALRLSDEKATLLADSLVGTLATA